jgi:hypothetical protein
MSLQHLFKLEKLHIDAYEDVERKKSASPASMAMMFNPESYKEQHGITYQEARGRQAINSPGKPAKYAYTPPGELAFKFIFDGTGVNYFAPEMLVRVLKGESVDKQIEIFKQLCLDMNGDTHQPHFLVVRWGKALNFPCRLKTLDITFTLFDRSGDPIRAELDVSFVYDESQETITRQAGKNSPDLTHIRTVKSGDTLPFLCKQIYGSSKHYLFIARANHLDDFRNLVPGQQISFPPLQNHQGNSTT